VYCSRCGAGMGPGQWVESIYCYRCGAMLVKGLDPFDRTAMPPRSTRTVRAVAGTVANRPVLGSIASVGIGALGVALGPLLVVAGQWLAAMGVGAMLLGWLVDLMDETKPCRGGARYGAIMAGIGVLAIGAGYVVLAAGVVSTVFGVGLGAYTGVKAYVGYRRTQRLIVNEPLLISEGGE